MNTNLKIAILMMLLMMLWTLPLHAAESRSVKIAIRDSAGQKVGLYENSYALVIGVSDYTNGWPDLPGVRKDVVAVKKVLEKHGFQVTIVEDPDSVALGKAYNDFISKHGRSPDDRLLLYFSGHGHTVTQAYGGEMGYIVPADAPNPNRDMDGFLDKALDMQMIEVYAKRIQSKHALFLFDSCFSGSLFAIARAVPENITYKTARPVRQFITAGDADEPVPDPSIFCEQFVEALNGEADWDADGYITGLELGEFLQKHVINYSRDSQHPQYGKIRDAKLDKGDFVFMLPDSIDDLRLEVNYTEGFHVSLNGRSTGKQAPTSFALSAGQYTVSLTKQGYKPYETVVDLGSHNPIAIVSGTGILDGQPIDPKLFVVVSDGKMLSKFSSTAFEKEKVIIETADASTFESSQPHKQYSGVIVERLAKRDKEFTEKLHDFVNKGGKAAVLVSTGSAGSNAYLQEYFSVSIEKSSAFTGLPEAEEGEITSIKGDSYCQLFKGLTIAGSGGHKPGARGSVWWNPAFRSKIVPVGNEWEKTSINVEGEKRCVSAWRKLGEGEILFLVSFEMMVPESFIRDSQIQLGQNTEASMNLVRWISGKTRYSR